MKTKQKSLILVPLNLPLWAHWTAIDSFGVFIAFEVRPVAVDGRWLKPSGRDKEVFQFDGQSYRGWTKTLCQICRDITVDVVPKPKRK